VVEDNGGEDDASELGDGVFVVAAGDAAPLLQAGEAAFDGVAFFVQVGVEVWWPSTEGVHLLSQSAAQQIVALDA